MVREDDNVDDRGQVARGEAREERGQHRVDAGNGAADFGAVGAVFVTVRVDVGDVHGY